MTDKFLNRQEAADWLTSRGLRTSWRTLQKFATTGGGPLYQIFGNKAVYTDENLNAWAKSRLSAPRRSTSELASMARAG